MGNEREQQIRTVVVDGDEASCKTALNRSILGVTFRKYKRKGREFYQHRNHNLIVTQLLSDCLYALLLTKTPLKNMSQYKIKTELVLRWDPSGKIIGASLVKASVYLKMGDLSVKNLKVYEEHEKIKIDFFYSTIDAASPAVRKQLLSIRQEIGEENFDYKEYDYQESNGKKMAVSYGVERVPTVVINDERFENPTEKELRSRIDLAFAPQVGAINPNFTLDPKTKSIVENLAAEIKIYEPKE